MLVHAPGKWLLLGEGLDLHQPLIDCPQLRVGAVLPPAPLHDGGYGQRRADERQHPHAQPHVPGRPFIDHDLVDPVQARTPAAHLP